MLQVATNGLQFIYICHFGLVLEMYLVEEDFLWRGSWILFVEIFKILFVSICLQRLDKISPITKNLLRWPNVFLAA